MNHNLLMAFRILQSGSPIKYTKVFNTTKYYFVIYLLTYMYDKHCVNFGQQRNFCEKLSHIYEPLQRLENGRQKLRFSKKKP